MNRIMEGIKVLLIMISVWIAILIQGLLLNIWNKDYGFLKEIIILFLFAYEWVFITVGIYTILNKEQSPKPKSSGGKR